MYDYISIKAKGASAPSLLSAAGAKAGDEVISTVQVDVVPGSDMFGIFGKFIPADGWIAYIGGTDTSLRTFLITLKRKTI